MSLEDEQNVVIEEDDFLDHPDSLEEFADDEETAEMRALFPEGLDEELERAWGHLFRKEELSGEEADRRFASIAAEEEIRGSAGRYSGSGRDTGIAARLRARGLKVVEVAGWQTRGSATFHPKMSVDHHTAGPLRGNSPSLGICINGRTGLPGPLCNVFIARDNTCYVVAAGRANHAGSGSYRGVSGNSNCYGVEHENTGVGNEPWRTDQRNTAAKVHAALLDGIGRDHTWNCQHKEWTTRKIDKWDQTGDDMRRRISSEMGRKPSPAPSPSPAPNTPEDDDMAYSLWRFDGENAVWRVDGGGQSRVHIPNPDALKLDQFFLAVSGRNNEVAVAKKNEASGKWLAGIPIVPNVEDRIVWYTDPNGKGAHPYRVFGNVGKYLGAGKAGTDAVNLLKFLGGVESNTKSKPLGPEWLTSMVLVDGPSRTLPQDAQVTASASGGLKGTVKFGSISGDIELD